MQADSADQLSPQLVRKTHTYLQALNAWRRASGGDMVTQAELERSELALREADRVARNNARLRRVG